MKLQCSKILLIVIITGFFSSCNSVKRVAENEYLLTENTVLVNDKKNNTETINNLLYQKTNRKILGFPLRLHIYNTARPNIDSIIIGNLNRNPKRKRKLEKFLSKKQLNRYIDTRLSFNKWLKRTGEAPVIVDTVKSEKSAVRLKAYYFNNGWFNTDVSYKVSLLENKKATIDYVVKTGDAYIIDSLTTKINTPVIDSLYNKTKGNSLIKHGEQYKSETFDLERSRITSDLRNSGIYHFGEDYVFFELDTVNTNKKVNVDLQIQNRIMRKQDSLYRTPFKVYKIKDVNIYTNNSFENRNKQITDSISFNNFKLYSVGEMRYKPKALTDAIFIAPGNTFRDIDRTRSYRYLSEQRTFKYPNIEYTENPDTTLTANIFLSPLKKFNLGFSAEISQSNIQTVGFSINPSLKIRNVFKGAETLELSAFGSVGSSKDASNDSDQFFDINEIGVDLKLIIPRLFSPFNTEKIIPKYMSPSTRISISATGQTNIGLDKQTLAGIYNYKWFPSKSVTNRLDLFNVQYVRNLNTANYFGVYQNSYNTLNSIAAGINYNNGEDLNFPEDTETFMNDVLNNNTTLTSTDNDYKTVSNISEREERLTEDNLIFSSNFNFVKDKRENLFDENFSIFRFKLEFAGNLLANTSQLLGLKKNKDGRYEIFNVAYSQYVKTELDYIKHWDLGKKNIFAIRSFLGIAIPYGNADNIPFSKSFFAGGANDNRAWTAYSLGPGSSDSNNEFNEANLKLALSFEQRFNLFGNLNAALFLDAGNIWNVWDSENNETAVFNSFNSLKDIAIGTGFGFRYDFSFFVFRFDIGFKTYDPSKQDQERWFKDYNFNSAVYNIGINYPF